MNVQTILKTTLLLAVLSMLTACGAQKATDNAADFSSRAVIPNSPSTNSTVLYCNQKSQNGITAKLMIYTDAANQVRSDYMKLKITQIPASFTSGDYIQLFRWQANTANQVYVDQIPVQARFETLDGRILTNFSSVIYWGQVSSIASNWGFSDVNAFFQNVRLVVDIRDPQANFDVLKIAMYDSKNTNTVNMDMLMPAFSASPDDYALEGGIARSNNLQALHPFANSKGQTWTAAQYISMATGFCF